MYYDNVYVVCHDMVSGLMCQWFFFFQAEDGIRDLVRSRGLGDVYKRQMHIYSLVLAWEQLFQRLNLSRMKYSLPLHEH